MIKRLIVICITILSTSASAQEGTASPYSFYGIGTLQFKGTVENRSMGGIGVYLDSIHINLRNPASYATKNVEGYPFNGKSRPVKFAVGARMTDTNLKTNTSETSTNTATVDYIAFAVPVGKFGFGFGMLPYTTVGYKLDDFNDDNELQNRFNGSGGVNKAYAGFGYQITDKLSVGVDVNYNFGSIENTAIAVAYTPEGNVVQYQTREFNRSDLSGVNFNLGMAYKTMVTNKLELSATLAFAPESTLSSENIRRYSTVTINATTFDLLSIGDITEVDLASDNLQSTDLTLPSRLAVGGGIGDPKSWFVGAEYTYMTTADFSNPIFSNQISSYEDASRISVGGFFIPNYNAFSGYFKRVVYRAGFNYANTGLVIKDESIKEFGISFGLGLPVGKRNLFSNANLGLEFGQRGTTRQNLVQENYINFNISLSMNARWFEQKKYN